MLRKALNFSILKPERTPSQPADRNTNKEENVEQIFSFKYLVAAIVYSLLGLLILIFSTWVFDKITPGDLWKEITIEKNLPLAIATGAMIIALGNIIAASLHG